MQQSLHVKKNETASLLSAQKETLLSDALSAAGLFLTEKFDTKTRPGLRRIAPALLDALLQALFDETVFQCVDVGQMHCQGDVPLDVEKREAGVAD